MKAMHDENQTGFMCDICGAYFRNQGNLTHHRSIVHTEDRPHTCHICNQSFKSIKTCKAHIRRHDPSHKETCPICGKTVSFGQLRAHIKRHTNDKKYQCESCSKAFHEKQDLQRHERIHSGDKPYKCSLCAYACAIRGNLTKHMNSHSTRPGRRGRTVTKNHKAKPKHIENIGLVSNVTENNRTKHVSVPVYAEEKYVNMTPVDMGEMCVYPLLQNYTQLVSVTQAMPQAMPQDMTDLQPTASMMHTLNNDPGLSELKSVNVKSLNDNNQTMEPVRLCEQALQHYSHLTNPPQYSQHVHIQNIDPERQASVLIPHQLQSRDSETGTTVENLHLDKPSQVPDPNQIPNVSQDMTSNLHDMGSLADPYRSGVVGFTPVCAAGYMPVDMHAAHLQVGVQDPARQNPNDVHHFMKAYPYFFQTYQQ